MTQMVVIAVLVFAVMYTLAEIGDRHGFSPLSKIARAFDSRPVIVNPPPVTASPDVPSAGVAGAESVVS
jgi:hypothetical protein